MRFAAIDIGTNAARLLVGEVTEFEGASFVKKVSYTRIPLRLGETVFGEGQITEKKRIEFAKSMKAFKLISEIFEVKQLRACATSAMREASNGELVRQQIAEETGVNIEIISGDEEAKLIFSTFFLLNIDKSVPFIVVDVGGGSTEVSVFEDGKRVGAKSFKVGTIRLLKKKTDPGIWKQIRNWLSEHVDLSELHQIYATGGNINKAHKILGGSYMKPLSVSALSDFRDQLSSLSLESRINMYQLKPDRADVLIPALDIYLYILKELDCSEIIVPKIGLSDGMIYSMYLDHK
ncbi:MAG: exopolyphosphatase [Crocinitomicaceae bacterium]|nr:exopolyphosphatase [Crocinitomicaceae bacterium]